MVVSNNAWPLIEGLVVSLAATGIALAIGVIGGVIVCAMSRSSSSMVRRVAISYVGFFRTVPEMVLIFWFYFCAPQVFGFALAGFWTGVIALGLVAAGYIAEIFRGGIAAVPLSQHEAGTSLGIPKGPLWLKIIIPQSIRYIIAPFVNYFSELLKNTTLLAGIGVGELAYEAYTLGATTYRYLEFLSAIAIGYFVVIFLLSMLATAFEKTYAVPGRSQRTSKVSRSRSMAKTQSLELAILKPWQRRRT